MSRQPTEQEFEAIMGIVTRVEADRPGASITWDQTHRDMDNVKLIYKSVTGRKAHLPNNCSTCHLGVLDELRAMVHLPPLTKPVSEELSAARLHKCQACPVYRERTRSCGRLVTDALSPRPVMVEGEEVTPCGCFLPIKVLSKYATCPANRWTR